MNCDAQCAPWEIENNNKISNNTCFIRTLPSGTSTTSTQLLTSLEITVYWTQLLEICQDTVLIIAELPMPKPIY